METPTLIKNQMHLSSLLTLGNGVAHLLWCRLGRHLHLARMACLCWLLCYGIGTAMQSLKRSDGLNSFARAELQAWLDPGIQEMVSRFCPSAQAGCGDHGC